MDGDAAADRLDVELDLTPGVLVSRAFAAGLDTDNDQQLSPAEIDAHSRRVSTRLSLQVDGRPVPLTVTHRAYPTRDLLASSAGVITITATAPLPAGARQVVLQDDYDPGLKNSVQMAALVASGQTAPMTDITHGSGGRTITLALGSPTTGPVDGAANRWTALTGLSGLAVLVLGLGLGFGLVIRRLQTRRSADHGRNRDTSMTTLATTLAR